MKPPKPGSVWVRKPSVLNTTGQVPVRVLVSTDRDVVHTDGRGGPGRTRAKLEAFRFHYEPAPEGTPEPVVWPPAAEPVDGALIVRLGDVPVGWLFRDGWEEPGTWTVRVDDDRSYEGALVECRPSDERDVILETEEGAA